jgi:hypothetical protein
VIHRARISASAGITLHKAAATARTITGGRIYDRRGSNGRRVTMTHEEFIGLLMVILFVLILLWLFMRLINVIKRSFEE